MITEAKEATQQHNKKRKQNKADSTNKPESHNRHTKKLEEGIPNPNGKKTRVLIVGDSQLRRVDEKKLSNDRRDVKINCKPGMKIKQAISEAGKTNKGIIIVHAATNDAKSSTPERLCKDVIDTLQQI